MIEAMLELGRMFRKEMPEPLVENPNSNGKYNHVLLLEMTRENQKQISWNGSIRHEEFDHAKIYKYMYRKGSGHSDYSPTSKLVTSNKELSKNIDKLITRLRRSIEAAGLQAIGLEKVKDDLRTAIESVNLPRSESLIVSLLVDGKYVGEVQEFKTAFNKRLLNETLKKNSPEEPECCFLCGKSTQLYANMSRILPFYTIDKHGFIAGGLSPELSWKNFAVCEECILDIERAKRFIEDKLSFKFYGKSFWLIPRTLSEEHRRDIVGLTERLRESTVDLGKQEKARQERIEDQILTIASEAKNVVAYEMVFTKKSNAAVRIILHLEELLPTRIKDFLQTREEVERQVAETVQPDDPETAWRYGCHFRFFSTVLRDSAEFYNLVDRVFRKQPVEPGPLLTKTMERIRQSLAEKSAVPTYDVNEAFTSFLFLKRWAGDERDESQIRGGISMSEKPFEEFFSRYEDFFDHPAKRGLFLMGVLTQKLLNLQYRQRGSTPFLKMLKSLRLSQDDATRLLPKIQNKLFEYEAGHYYADIREGVSVYMVEAGKDWGLSPDEVGFYLVLGMNLASKEPFKKEEEKEEVVSHE